MSQPTFSVAIELLVGMVASAWFGLWIEKSKSIEDENEKGVGLVVGSLFTLLGLLLAFTLSASAGRLDARRSAAVDEANAIGTAVLRLDFTPASERNQLRSLFRQYVDNRLDFNHALGDERSIEANEKELGRIQTEIWQLTSSATEPSVRMLVVPPINDTFDLASKRTILAQTYTPTPMFAFLILLAVICTFLVGQATAKTSHLGWLYRGVFCVAMSASLYMVADLDNPRVGIIRIDYVDQLLQSTKQSLL